MRWDAQHGAHVAHLRAAADRGAAQASRILARRRVVPEPLVPHWEMFQRLSICRSVGMGAMSGIPPSEIAAALDLMGERDPDYRRDAWEFIGAMDAAWLETMAARNGDTRRSD